MIITNTYFINQEITLYRRAVAILIYTHINLIKIFKCELFKINYAIFINEIML